MKWINNIKYLIHSCLLNSQQVLLKAFAEGYFMLKSSPISIVLFRKLATLVLNSSLVESVTSLSFSVYLYPLYLSIYLLSIYLYISVYLSIIYLSIYKNKDLYAIEVGLPFGTMRFTHFHKYIWCKLSYTGFPINDARFSKSKIIPDLLSNKCKIRLLWEALYIRGINIYFTNPYSLVLLSPYWPTTTTTFTCAGMPRYWNTFLVDSNYFLRHKYISNP